MLSTIFPEAAESEDLKSADLLEKSSALSDNEEAGCSTGRRTFKVRGFNLFHLLHQLSDHDSGC